jgi:hypothetical protein
MSMDNARLKHNARITVLLSVAVLATEPARAGGHAHHGCTNGPGCLSPAAMPATYPPPVAAAYPLGDPWCYAIPIRAVYQFPAVIANQPGAEVGWLQTNPEYGALGGRPYLYHP